MVLLLQQEDQVEEDLEQHLRQEQELQEILLQLVHHKEIQVEDQLQEQEEVVEEVVPELLEQQDQHLSRSQPRAVLHGQRQGDFRCFGFAYANGIDWSAICHGSLQSLTQFFEHG
jgi:hypothetical protein